MKPYTLHRGDVLAMLRTMPDCSFDSIVTDPPYELGFMGKGWDKSGIANNPAMWAEAMRVLKPGGHLLAFSGSRTYHRMACAIEDGGFEVRDQIMWVYGSGFPKSLDVGKAIDKAAGAEREVIGPSATHTTKAMNGGAFNSNGNQEAVQLMRTNPATDTARQWNGWGTALKPAHEPICVARKPLIGTVATNVLEHGTGALNIDVCRVEGEPVPVFDTKGGRKFEQAHTQIDRRNQQIGTSSAGRWPANLIHDGSDEVVALFPHSVSGSMKAGTKRAAQDGPGSVCYGTYGGNATSEEITGSAGSAGSAARFFYCAKASRSDRNEGLISSSTPAVETGATMRDCETVDWSTRNGNHHPTVKPTDLMAYLVRLVTPPGGKVLDLFFGSGSTGKACMREGFEFVGIDKDEDETGQPAGYLEIATARIEYELARVTAANAPPPLAPQLDLFEIA